MREWVHQGGGYDQARAGTGSGMRHLLYWTAASNPSRISRDSALLCQDALRRNYPALYRLPGDPETCRSWPIRRREPAVIRTVSSLWP